MRHVGKEEILRAMIPRKIPVYLRGDEIYTYKPMAEILQCGLRLPEEKPDITTIIEDVRHMEYQVDTTIEAKDDV